MNNREDQLGSKKFKNIQHQNFQIISPNYLESVQIFVQLKTIINRNQINPKKIRLQQKQKAQTLDPHRQLRLMNQIQKILKVLKFSP